MPSQHNVPDEMLDSRWAPLLSTLLEAAYSAIPYVDELSPPRNYREAVTNGKCDLLLRAVVRQMGEMTEGLTDPLKVKAAVEEELLRMAEEVTDMAMAVCNFSLVEAGLMGGGYEGGDAVVSGDDEQEEEELSA